MPAMRRLQAELTADAVVTPRQPLRVLAKRTALAGDALRALDTSVVVAPSRG